MEKLLRTVFAFAMIAAVAYATETTVNQGSPGNRGPWVVASSSGTGIAVTPQQCTSMAHKVTSVGVAAGNTPSSQLTSRRYIVLCNSLQNTGTPLVKCRADGVAPVMAAGNAGDVLGVGDCLPYPVAAGTVIQCIADTAATSVTSFECL